MHIGGMGDQEPLASAVGRVFAAIKQTSGGNGEISKAEIDPAKTTLNPQRIEAVLGIKGELKDGVYKVTVGRTTRMQGLEVGNAMGVNPGRRSSAPTTGRWSTATSPCASRNSRECSRRFATREST